ncbi:MAG: type II secretion system F family protein [Rhodocyclaceae bacterium]
MDTVFLMFGVAVFIAVVLGLEGLYLWWNDRHGPEASRLERRLRTVSAGGHAPDQLSIMKRRVLSESQDLQRFLVVLPRVQTLDRMLVQSGINMSVAEVLGLAFIFAATGFVAALLFGRSVIVGLVVALMLGILPILYVMRERAQRLRKLESQLPDAIDLMGRALRAGHAFPTALRMLGEEMADPVGAEFRVLFDELNYGVTLQNALLNFLARVPSTDLRYFVVAVLIQRDTGGNLAELLDNISAIVRARIKLMGEVRTLSAEGRLSAWILSALPFATGLLLTLVNPGFLSVLWKDPMGLNLVYGALAMMVLGVWWMSRVVKIRV